MSTKIAAAILTTALLSSTAALAAEPVRIGVTTILSGPIADRGQSEQYGIELALSAINQAGGVLGRPVVAFYGDNGANVPKGLAAVHRLIDEEHVPVLIGALATPVTHAIMPIVEQDKIPLIIDISAGQDFVDASGVGGNPYVFKTIPSDLDIARGMIGWMKGQGGMHKVALLTDEGGFTQANGNSFAKAASAAGFDVVANETVPKGTTDLGPLLAKLKEAGADHLVTNLGPSNAAFFHAYEQSGWDVPVDGRIDLAGAIAAVSPAFLARGGLKDVASIVVYTPLLTTPSVHEFVTSYEARYGLVPTQRSFFAYEAAYLAVDAIKRAGSDKPADIEAALRSSQMPSRLGGTYAMDDHNHPHTPMQILGTRDGKVAIIGAAGSE